MIHIFQSVSDTRAFGHRIAAKLKSGDIIALHGDLGSGKTTLTQGIAQGLGVKHVVTSPTFTLIQLYPLNHQIAHQLAHIDTYRARNEQEMISVGIQEILHDKQTISIVEWPEKIQNLLPSHTIHLSLTQKNSIHEIEYPDNWL